MNPLSVAELGCLPLSLQIVSRLLDRREYRLSQPLGRLHLRFSPQLVVVGELVPGFRCHAALHGAGGVRVKTYVCRVVIKFETFTVNVESNILVGQVTIQLLPCFL